MHGIVKRLKNTNYKVEITGKSSVVSDPVYIMKITLGKGENELDSRISYETIAFDPQNFTVRSWMVYEDERSKPFFSLVFKEIKLLSSVPEDEFKV